MKARHDLALSAEPLNVIEMCTGVGMLGEGLRSGLAYLGFETRMKEIPGYEGRYSAEEDGRIYSHITRRYLRPSQIKGVNRYRRVNLVPASGGADTCPVHLLVLLTFVGPCPDGMEGRHLDGNAGNNALANLAWATHAVNLLDKNDHGTMLKGEAHHACGISDANVVRLRAKRGEGMSFPKLGALFGISKSQAHRICAGINRKAALQ